LCTFFFIFFSANKNIQFFISLSVFLLQFGMLSMNKGTTFFIAAGDAGATGDGPEGGICGKYWYVNHNLLLHMCIYYCFPELIEY
jgi:subtilase family serine protease